MPRSPKNELVHSRPARHGLLPKLAALLVLATLTHALPAHAAGFDCNKASSDTEKLICRNPELSALDSQLAAAYKTALGAVSASSKNALLKEQRNWIRHTRDICQDETCLRDAYSARIGMLSRNEAYIVNRTSCDVHDGGSCRSVVYYRDTNSRIDSFNQSLATDHQAGRIIGCKTLVDLPVGTASGNHSFGGYCQLERTSQRSDVEICNDDMFGHFSMQPIDPKHAKDQDLIDFTNANCYGG